MNKTISISDAFRFGWESFKKEWKFLVPALALIYVISWVFDSLVEHYFKGIEPTASLLSLVAGLVSLFLYFNLLRALLSIKDGQSPRFESLFSYRPTYWKYVLATIAFGLIVAFGFLLLIIPGIYFYLRYGFYGQFIADREIGVIDAFRESARITDGAKWQLLLLGLLAALAVFLGFLVIFVGVFVAAPVVALGYVFVYRSLLLQSGKGDSQVNGNSSMVETPLATPSLQTTTEGEQTPAPTTPETKA